MQARNRAVSIRKEIEQRMYRKTHDQRQEQIQRKKTEKLERERAEYVSLLSHLLSTNFWLERLGISMHVTTGDGLVSCPFDIK